MMLYALSLVAVATLLTLAVLFAAHARRNEVRQHEGWASIAVTRKFRWRPTADCDPVGRGHDRYLDRGALFR